MSTTSCLACLQPKICDYCSTYIYNFNPTEGYSNIVDNRLDELTEEGDLSEEIAEGLKTDNPRTPHFYLLPKIHKEGNPGRPVVSSIDSHTSKISKYVDYHIQPIAKVIKSYVQDTSDFIEKINQVGTVPENTFSFNGC